MRRATVCLLTVFLFAIFLEWWGGTFDAEFSGSDEAAHLVTSLMVHDYVASGMPGSPVKFAENYYVRYPKVAFGIWPPLFHLSQAAWMLLFSPTRASILLLTILWAALLATSAFIAARTHFPGYCAAALAFVLISLPEIQQAAGSVMADLMVACFMFGAALFYGRYLNHERWRDALGFGVLSAVAILVKYNALALALVPPIAILLTRRFGAIRRASFWLPGLVVIGLCEPWYFYSRHLVRYAMDPMPGIADIPWAATANTWALVSLVGVPLFLLAAIGAVTKLRTRPEGIWVSSAALILALWFFHSVLYPISEGRYLLAAAPPLLLFAAAGCEAVARWAAPRLGASRAFSIVCLIALLLYAAVSFRIQVKRHYGVSQVAADLVRQGGDPGALVLVSGSAETEGMLISEMALRDRNQSLCVLRASKVLAHSTWMGQQYEMVYRTSGEIARFLRELPITAVVIDRSNQYARPHHRLLEQALCEESALWEPDRSAVSDTVRVYRRTEPVIPSAHNALYIDLTRTLGRSLEAPAGTPAAVE